MRSFCKAMERRGPSAMLLTNLPDDCILPVLLCLDVQGALDFRRMCRRMDLLLKQSQNDYWLPRLRRDFGLHLQVWCLIWDVPRLAVLLCQKMLLTLLSHQVHHIWCHSCVTYPRLPLSPRCCALVRQAVPKGSYALSALYRSMFAAMPALKQVQAPVRFVGVFTDGGVDRALHQFRTDNMYATTSLLCEQTVLLPLLSAPSTLHRG